MTSGLERLKGSEPLQQRRTTPDLIADALREAIFAGEFEDGEELNQVALAEHFGVSRVPLREAMRQLQAEGLITVEAHRRAVVTGLTPETLVELFDLRTLLESYLLELALPSTSGKELEELADICKRMEATSDRLEWLSLNREFHRLLYRPARRAFSLSLVEQLMGKAQRYLNLWSAGKGIERRDEANREHRRILAAAKRGDVEGATQVLRTHIAHTRQRVEAMFLSREDEQEKR